MLKIACKELNELISGDKYALRTYLKKASPLSVAGNSFYIFGEGDSADVLKAVTNIVDHKRHTICKVMVICELLLVIPATSATEHERSVSVAGRVKKWLRTTMNQQRFNHVAIYYIPTRQEPIRFGK